MGPRSQHWDPISQSAVWRNGFGKPGASWRVLGGAACVAPCTRRSQRLSFLIAFAQYLFDSLHDWHLKILLVAAIIRHLAHIFFQGLQINHSVVAFGIIVTAEPRGDEPRLTDFVMHELVAIDFRNVETVTWAWADREAARAKMATKATQTHFRGIRLSSQEIAILAKRPIGCTDSVNRLEDYVLVSIRRGPRWTAPDIAARGAAAYLGLSKNQ